MTSFRLCNAIAACLNSFDKGDSNMLLQRYTLPLILTAISVFRLLRELKGAYKARSMELTGLYRQ